MRINVFNTWNYIMGIELRKRIGSFITFNNRDIQDRSKRHTVCRRISGHCSRTLVSTIFLFSFISTLHSSLLYVVFIASPWTKLLTQQQPKGLSDDNLFYIHHFTPRIECSAEILYSTSVNNFFYALWTSTLTLALPLAVRRIFRLSLLQWINGSIITSALPLKSHDSNFILKRISTISKLNLSLRDYSQNSDLPLHMLVKTFSVNGMNQQSCVSPTSPPRRWMQKETCEPQQNKGWPQRSIERPLWL